MLTPNRWSLLLGFAVAAFAALCPAPAQKLSPDELVAAVVRVKTFINPEAQTLSNLGREREGSGVVIDGSGLVLTIGYLMVEAYAAEVTTNDGQSVPANVVGYDHVTGFGLLQASAPLKVKPMAFGKSAEIKEGDGVVVASFGGWENAAPAFVFARREFAGSWEYLLDEAIFTAPPHGAWSGAALISREGKLVGIGSLLGGGSTRKKAQWAPHYRARPAQRPSRQSGTAARRYHRGRGRRGAEKSRRFLSQGLGAGAC